MARDVTDAVRQPDAFERLGGPAPVARVRGLQAGRQLLVVLLRGQNLLAQRDVFLSQRVAQLGHLADLRFEGIEFSVHGGTIGGGAQAVNCTRGTWV